ncbi:hypothetical protein Tco_0198341, partial [Tanacetum coccineum]
MKCNPTFFCGIEGAIELRRWFEKIESVFRISKCVEGKKTEMKQLITAEFCPIEEIQRLENELWNLKVKEVKFANLSKAVRMAHKLMEQKSQARNERILEGKKRKWENHQGGNSSGKGNQKDNSCQTLQNNQKQ